MDFRPAYLALANRLQADLQDVVRAFSRQNLPARSFPDQPALVLLEDRVNPRGAPGVPMTWELDAILVLHTQAAGEDLAPGEQVLNLISRVHQALSPHGGESTPAGPGSTLGGQVIRAWVEETTIEDSLYDASQVSTVLHVRMLAHDA